MPAFQVFLTLLTEYVGMAVFYHPTLAKVAGGAHGTDNFWCVLQHTQSIILTLTCTTIRITLQYMQLGHTFCSDCNILLGSSSISRSLVCTCYMLLDHRQCYDNTRNLCHAVPPGLAKIFLCCHDTACGLMACNNCRPQAWSADQNKALFCRAWRYPPG